MSLDKTNHFLTGMDQDEKKELLEEGSKYLREHDETDLN